MPQGRISQLFISTLLLILTFTARAAQHEQTLPLYLFSLKPYSQQVNVWLNPRASNYDTRLVSEKYQHSRQKDFYAHDYGKYSPWSQSFMQSIFKQEVSIQELERQVLASFDNRGKGPGAINYGENYRPYSQKWIERIHNNIGLAQFKHLTYNPSKRAITVLNLHARLLPTMDPAYYHLTIAGQGYPFDNLQLSNVWAGTPVYVLGTTKDRAWDLVVTPAVIGWVKAQGVAKTTKAFIHRWQKAAQKQMAAITRTKTSVSDIEGVFRFYGYVGQVFPVNKVNGHSISIFTPFKNTWGVAITHVATLQKNNIVLMPYPATPHHFATIIKTLIGRPYGWGGVYFDNDCSEEMKSLFAPFGIWLPRHSAEQIFAGRWVNLSEEDVQERKQYLFHHAAPLMTIIYVGGHVIMYVGKYPNPNSLSHKMVAVSYQDVWGLNTRANNSRAVIGKAVFLPLLAHYPQNPKLISHIDKGTFILSFLNQWPTKQERLHEPPAASMLGL